MGDVTSIRQLSSVCGRTPAAVAKWLQHPRFPVQREAPWSDDDVAEIKAWMRTLQPNRADPGLQGRRAAEPPADDQSKDYWLMRKYRAQALEAEGELVQVKSVLAQVMTHFGELRSRMLMVPASLRTLCDRVSGDEVEKRAEELIRAGLDDIADRLERAANATPVDGSDGEGAENASASVAEPVG